MADLIKIAKSSNITVFTAAYCNEQSPKLDPTNLTTAQTNTILATYNSYKNNPTMTPSKDDDGTKGKGSLLGNISNVTQKLAVTQTTQNGYLPSMTEEYLKVDEILNKIIDKQTGLNNLQDIGQSLIGGMGDQVKLYLTQQTELLGVMNKGGLLAGEASQNFRAGLTDATPELIRVGIGFNDLAQAGQQLVRDTGKFASLTTETWQKAGVAATAYVGTLSEVVAMIPEFTKVGIGAIKTVEAIENAGKRAMGVGLTAQKTTKDLNTNIGKLNEYGFKNGVDGLARMVMKAAEFRMSMDEVFKVAEKVMSPEGAIDLSANLQVLGGAIGDLGDPLKMMYMATNNVEGLQDSLIKAASSLATYNSEQGRFELTGANLRRAKAEADALGMSYQEFSKGAIAAAERGAAAGQMMAAGLQLDSEQSETLTNLAQMGKGGKMEIALNSDAIKDALKIGRDSKSIALENLSQSQAQTLLKYQDELKEKTPEEIVRGQATSIGNMERDLNFIVALLRVEGGKTAESIAKAMGDGMGFSLKDKSNQLNKFATREGEDVKGWIRTIRSDSVDAIKEAFKPSAPDGKTKVNKDNISPVVEKKATNDVVADNKKAADANTNMVSTSTNPYSPLTNPYMYFQFSLKNGADQLLNVDQNTPGSYLYKPK